MTADRPPVSGEPRTEKCDAVLAYCALPMRHEGTHQYPHAAIEAEASTGAALDVERLAEALKAEGFVRGVAGRYGTFNEVYWQQSAEFLAARLAEQEGEGSPERCPTCNTSLVRATTSHIHESYETCDECQRADDKRIRHASTGAALDPELLTLAIVRAFRGEETAVTQYDAEQADDVIRWYARLAEQEGDR